MQIVINLIIALISLCVLIVIHEFGHFITAKIFRVYVYEFSIGFGPALYSKRRKNKETKFSVRCIPLGGYCSMIGEDLPEFTEEEYNSLSVNDKELVDLTRSLPPERKLNGIARWKRIIILIAGVTLNFLLGYVLFFFSAVSMPLTYGYSNQVTVSENSLAYDSGWRSEDVIASGSYVVYINNQIAGERKNVVTEGDVDYQTNLYRLITEAASYKPIGQDDYIHFTLITTEDKEIVFNLGATTVNKETSWNAIGITLSAYTRKTTVKEWFTLSGDLFVQGSSALLKGIGMMFTPEGFAQTGGLISIFQMSSQATSIGLYYYLYLWGLISVNLAIFNLLPFPGLDGWHILVNIIEGITRRELPKKFKTVMSTIGMVLLFGLFIVVTFKDIFRLF